MIELSMRQRLEALLRGHRPLAVAVSGGVDSLTLAHLAHGALGRDFEAFHAVSPAVPPEASERVRRHASHSGWRLQFIDAGEFRDPAYLANPVNRCFFCKFNLYGAIRERTEAAIASGTNLDDLGDFRPGLEAADGYGVLHPYVMAEIDKEGVRRLARDLRLTDLAELPAAPCLSSRLQTGIRVSAAALAFVHEVERLIGATLAPETVRCRVRRDGIAIELDAGSLARMEAPESEPLRRRLQNLCGRHGHEQALRFLPYRRGSAFERVSTHGA